MGCGTYWAVVYGCRDVRARGNGKKLDAGAWRGSKLDEIFAELGIQRNYEGSSDYAGVGLLCTLDGRTRYIPSNVMSIDELPAAIHNAAIKAGLKKAERKWTEARKQAEKIGLALPEGELLWLSDYD